MKPWHQWIGNDSFYLPSIGALPGTLLVEEIEQCIFVELCFGIINVDSKKNGSRRCFPDLVIASTNEIGGREICRENENGHWARIQFNYIYEYYLIFVTCLNIYIITYDFHQKGIFTYLTVLCLFISAKSEIDTTKAADDVRSIVECG